jgi:hypothetical protein
MTIRSGVLKEQKNVKVQSECQTKS